MTRSLDWPALEKALLATLASGPQGSPELTERLGVSQPSLSRLLARIGRRDLLGLRPAPVVAFGRARLRRYGLREDRPALPAPIHEVDEDGGITEVGHLEAIAPGLLVAHGAGLRPELATALPWFLRDLAPAGYLARDLGDPVAYVARHGANLPGAFVVGEAVAEVPRWRQAPPDRVGPAPEDLLPRIDAPPEPGSIVGGAHPKLLATRGAAPVVVRFSPPRTDPRARRIADVLIAQHLALQQLARVGHPVAPSRIVEVGDRVLLEVERSDRTAWGGRRGLVSLAAVAERFGDPAASSWSKVSAGLLAEGRIDEEVHRAVRFREQFARFVADVPVLDNLALTLRRTRITGLAPAWGVGPRALSPRGDELPRTLPRLRSPPAANRDVAYPAQEAAIAFWSAVRDDERISDDVRALARTQRTRLGQFRA